MGKIARYRPTGFMLLGQVDAGGLRTFPAAIVNIKKGDVLHDDDTGYVTNATVAITNTFCGVAAADCDNSGGSKGTLDVQVIPPLQQYRFAVAVGDNALITQTAVGLWVDLQAVNTIDINDSVTTGPAFRIDEIDVSAAAIAANAYGYAIGHFETGLSAVT